MGWGVTVSVDESQVNMNAAEKVAALSHDHATKITLFDLDLFIYCLSSLCHARVLPKDCPFSVLEARSYSSNRCSSCIVFEWYFSS
jgi:hypothetical protein